MTEYAKAGWNLDRMAPSHCSRADRSVSGPPVLAATQQSRTIRREGSPYLPELVYRSSWSHSRIQLDFSKRAFVSGDILLEQSEKCLRLLRAEVDSLEVPDINLGFALLLERPENQEEIPDVHSHLDAIRVILSIVLIIG